MMSPPPDAACITITDRTGALERVHAWLQAFMRDKPFSARLRHDLELITEELLVNSLRHAKGRRCITTISVWRDDAGVWLEFQDSGDPFNPLDVPAPDLSADLADRRVGGLGLHLVRQLTDYIDYRYQDGVNHLQVGKALSGVDPQPPAPPSMSPG